MPEADVRGAKVFYELAGNGTPLILLLPQSTGPAGRQGLIDGLARHHTVVTYDPLGTGRSAPPNHPSSIEAEACDVEGLMDALALAQAHVACHSTGCGIGLSLAARYPARVAGLVLTAPWSYADDYLHTMQTLRKSAARALNPEQYARFNAAVLFPPEFRRDHAAGFAEQATHARAHPQDAEAIARRLDAILEFDARPLLPAIRCPTLVAFARDDQLMPPWFAEEIASAIQSAERVEFARGGHMLPETRTTEFVVAVAAFLDTVDCVD